MIEHFFIDYIKIKVINMSNKIIVPKNLGNISFRKNYTGNFEINLITITLIQQLKKEEYLDLIQSDIFLLNAIQTKQTNKHHLLGMSPT